MTPWTTRYAQWTGTFAELIETANAILADIPEAEVVTERTARHYQNVGVVGKGTRTGRTAHFTADDLAALVNAKTLAKDVGLKMVSALSQSYAPSAVSDQVSVSYGAPSSEGAPVNAATALVASLMANSPPASSALPLPSLNALTHTPSTLTSSIGGSVLRGCAGMSASAGGPAAVRLNAFIPPAQASVSPPPAPGRAFHHHTPVHWLTIAIDEAEATRAAPIERADAARVLRALADRLTTKE